MPLLDKIKKWSGKYWDKVQDWLGMLARQRHLIALRDGMIAVVPIILVGSTSLLLGSQKDVFTKYLPEFAESPFGVWYRNNCGLILLPYRFSMGMLSIYVAFTIAASLAGYYKLPVLPQGLGSVVAFLITIKPFNIPIEEGGKAVWMLPLRPLGGEGLFLAILCGIFTVEFSRLINYLWEKFVQRPIKKESEDIEKNEGSDDSENASQGIPRAVADAFASFLPLLCVVTIIWIVHYTFNIDIYNGLISLMKPLETMGDSILCVVVVNFFLHLFGVAGIHGISVINGVFFALWQKFLLLNTDAHASGEMLLYTTAYPFYQWFVWIGGAGTTLPIPFLLLFFRNPHMKRIGKVSLVPTLFNVNEPILFGLPVVANPLLAVPFITVPMITGTMAYVTISLGFASKPFIEVPWVLPSLLGAPLCNQDYRSLILLAINVTISAVIWYPFLKAYEKKLTPPKAR